MIAPHVLSVLRAAGIELRVEGGRLRFRPATVSAETRAQLREHKTAILRRLEREQAAEDEALIASLLRSDEIDRKLALAPCVYHACPGADFWASCWRDRICRRCHAPAPGAEVAS